MAMMTFEAADFSHGVENMYVILYLAGSGHCHLPLQNSFQGVHLCPCMSISQELVMVFTIL